MIWKKTLLTVPRGGEPLFPIPSDPPAEPESEELITVIHHVDNKWGMELTHTQANSLRRILASLLRNDPALSLAPDDRDVQFAWGVDVEESDIGYQVIVESFFCDLTPEEAAGLLEALEEV